jgi:hypothetical protein
MGHPPDIGTERMGHPPVPGKTEFERFDNAMQRVLTVSKEELLKREAREKRDREHKRRSKKH